MPALPSAPQVLKIELKYHDIHDADIINRFYMQYTSGAPSSGQLDTFAAGVGAAMGSSGILGFISTETHVDECIVTDLTSPTSAVGSAGLTLAGLDSGTPMGAGVAVLINFLMSRRYRGGHPRIYLPGPTHTIAADSATIASGFLTTIHNAFNTWMTEIEALDWSGPSIFAVNVSYYEGFTNFTYPSGRTRARPTLRVTPVIDPITGYVVNSTFGSQRRRYGRSG